MSREAVAAAARALARDGLNVGTAGNVSARGAHGVLITPSGIAPAALEPDQVVEVALDGHPPDIGLRPSSEWPFHRAVYRARSDVGAIVHTHSPWASAVSCTRRPIPAFHYMVAIVGGPSIRCAPYAPPGSDALAVGAVEALGERQACLLANHGAIAVGVDVEAAQAMAVEVESLAQQYCLAQLAGGPVLLEDGEMSSLLEIFKQYGQPR